MDRIADRRIDLPRDLGDRHAERHGQIQFDVDAAISGLDCSRPDGREVCERSRIRATGPPANRHPVADPKGRRHATSEISGAPCSPEASDPGVCDRVARGRRPPRLAGRAATGLDAGGRVVSYRFRSGRSRSDPVIQSPDTACGRSCAICGKVSMGGFNPQSSEGYEPHVTRLWVACSEHSSHGHRPGWRPDQGACLHALPPDRPQGVQVAGGAGPIARRCRARP